MNIFAWIDYNLEPKPCDSVRLLYDDMESQSGKCLPIIYQPFDPGNKAHWCDRGAAFDFLLAIHGEGRRLLDLGPGDGWPALIVAPLAAEVVGVDASLRRVEVCRDNAARLGISNVEFIHVDPGRPLPFDDEAFDGVMAASSVEQTPDPKRTLREVHRVLRPGGRFRIRYEDLDRYRDGRRYDTWLVGIDESASRLILSDRHIEEEYAAMYGITFGWSAERLALMCGYSGTLPFEQVTVELLERLRPGITETLVCRLRHPSAATLIGWMSDIGFTDIKATHSGAWFAGEVFQRLAEGRRPRAVDAIDAYLRPLVAIVVEMAAPVAQHPPLTAIK
jgi:SAM-dependent methyltransferase